MMPRNEKQTDIYSYSPLILKVGNIVDVLFGVISKTVVPTVIPAVFSVKPVIDDLTLNQWLCTTIFLEILDLF